MKKLIAGNWKMNGTREQAKTLVADVVNGIHHEPGLLERCDFVVCPPAVHMGLVRHALVHVTHVALGGQDCSIYTDGAYTGDVSASMLADMNCSYVIVGHSERRQHHKETDDTVRLKAARAHEQGLIAIICVGEGEKDRAADKQEKVVGKQLAGSIPDSANAQNTVIAYEPVWAIGTGKTAGPEEAAAMHGFIRNKLQGRITASESVRILYGGSVKPSNAASLLRAPDVDGVLVGGASLKAGDFLGIALAAQKG